MSLDNSYHDRLYINQIAPCTGPKTTPTHIHAHIQHNLLVLTLQTCRLNLHDFHSIFPTEHYRFLTPTRLHETRRTLNSR